MNRPMPRLDPSAVPWEEPHITVSGHHLHRPAVFAAHVLPCSNRFGIGPTPLPLPNGKSQEGAQR